MENPRTLWHEMEEFGETTTDEGHKVFVSGKEDKHGHGAGFAFYNDIVNTVTGCRPVSSKLITICLRAFPFNITIVQWWLWNRRILWPATECHWSDTEEGHSWCVRRDFLQTRKRNTHKNGHFRGFLFRPDHKDAIFMHGVSRASARRWQTICRFGCRFSTCVFLKVSMITEHNVSHLLFR